MVFVLKGKCEFRTVITILTQTPTFKRNESFKNNFFEYRDMLKAGLLSYFMSFILVQ